MEITALADLADLDTRILEALSDGAWVSDVDHRIVFANTAMARICGLTVAEIQGRNVLDMPEETIRFFRDSYQTASRTLASQQYEALVVTPVGRPSWQAGWLTPLAVDGAFAGMLCVVREVSERKVAQEALRAQLEFDEALMAAARAPVMVLDRQGRIERINPFMEALSGYLLAEVRGRDGFDTLVPEPERIAARQRFRAVLDGEASGTGGEGNMLSLLTRRGESRRIRWQERVLKDAQGQARALLAVGIDTTDHESSLLQLEHLVAEQQALFGGDLVGLAKVRDRTILWANPAFADMLGYRQEELVNQSTRVLYASEQEYQRFGREAYPVVEAGRTFRTDVSYRRKDGCTGWLAVSLRQLPTDRHEFISVLIDITERKHFQAGSEEARQRLELALSGSDLGMWDWDIPSGRVSFNARWGEMLGYRPDELAPEVDTWKHLVHPDDWPDINNALQAHLRGETPNYESEHRLRHKGGHWVWVLDRGKVVARDAEGNPLRAAGTHLDVSDRKRLKLEGTELLRRIESLISGLDARPGQAGPAGNGGSGTAETHVPLSVRQRQVIGLIASGCTSTQIADRLNISPATAATHRRDLMRKLGLHSTADLTRYAIRHKLFAG